MPKIVRFHEVGGPEVLRIEEEAPKQPGKSEVRNAPLPSHPNQKPTWRKATDLVRNWELNQLARRLEELASD